jgi:hypothetical protein
MPNDFILIKEIADNKERITHRRVYSEDEINMFNAEHTANVIHIMKLNEIVKKINAEKLEFREQCKNLIIKVQFGWTYEDIDALYIDDQKDGVRRYYRETGEFIEESKLRQKNGKLKSNM